MLKQCKGYCDQLYDRLGDVINNIQQTATMLAFDNSQISQETPQDNTSQSELQELNNLRQMLPQPIARLDQYLIRQEMDDQQSEESSFTNEEHQMILKISQQTQLILQLQEKLYYYRSECMRLIDENQQIKENFRQLEQATDHKDNLCLQLQKKLEDEYLKSSHLQKQKRALEENNKELNKIMQKNLQRKQKQISFRNTYNQQLLSKELLLQQKIIVDLTSKNQKMLKINFFLQNELRMAEEKLINFQMEVQQKMCSILVENVSRLKQNQTNFNKSVESYSLTQTNSIPKVNFSKTSNRPSLQENKTVKLPTSQQFHIDQQKMHPSKEFKTIEKERILKAPDYKYDYKLQPVQSPKPQRKSNRILSFQTKKDQKQQRYRQSIKYNF